MTGKRTLSHPHLRPVQIHKFTCHARLRENIEMPHRKTSANQHAHPVIKYQPAVSLNYEVVYHIIDNLNHFRAYDSESHDLSKGLTVRHCKTYIWLL